MIIAQIGPYPINPSVVRGGVEASVFGLAQALSRKKSKVYVLDLPRLEVSDIVEEKNCVTIFRFNNPGPHQKDSVRRINDMMERILEIKPSVCHIHGTGILAYSIIKMLKKHGIPTVLTVHGLVTIEKRKALKQHFSVKTLYQYTYQSCCERKILSCPDRIIVDTEYVAQAIKGYRVKKVPEMVVIPQGIDESFYSIKCSPTSRTILSVGSISKRKGHLLLIQAFKSASEKLKDIQLIICGALADKAYFHELQLYINTLPCKDRITLKTNVMKEELLKLYSKAHVFALHSQEESQGIVFVEAMATGLPIIATRVGGIPFVIEDNKNGYLSDFGDTESFAYSITRMMDKDYDWEGVSAQNVLSAKRYSWDYIADTVIDLYTNALNI